MRQLTSSIIILSALFSSFAHANVYINGGAGVTEGSFKYYLEGTPQNEFQGEINGVGQLGLGVSHEWSTFFGGIEAGYEWQGFNPQKQTTVTSTESGGFEIFFAETRLENDFYLHLKPGYVVKDAFVVYGLVGVLGGNFKITDTSGDLGTKQSSEHKSTQVGYRLGLGIANQVKNHFEWRLEYTYNGYDSIETVFQGKQDPEPLHFNRTNIAINQFLFGIGYYF